MAMGELRKDPDVATEDADSTFRLTREAARRLVADLDAMTRLQELGAHFVRECNLEAVLGEIVDAAIAIAHADFGNVQLLDSKTGDLRMAAQRGFPAWWLDFWSATGKGQGSCGTALERGQRVIVDDVERSRIFAGTAALQIQLRAGVRAVQSTPLVARSGAPLGMFSTHYKTPHRPDERALRLLDLLARQASDMIERDKAERALTASRAMLQVAEDHERRRVAHDLHDNLAQLLAAVEIRLAKLCEHPDQDVRARVCEAAALVARADRWTRSLAAQLAPAALYELGLSAALGSLAEEMEWTFGLAVAVVDDGLSKPLSQEARSIVYRAVRELLINAAKHSETNAATVETLCIGDRLIVKVADRGVGFDPSSTTSVSGRLGLVGMRERLSFIGATFDVESRPGNGTSATLAIPITESGVIGH